MFNFFKKKDPEEIAQEVDNLVEQIPDGSEKILDGSIDVTDPKRAKEQIKGQYFIEAAAAFSHHQRNQKFLLMFFDPETDIFYISYDDAHAFNRVVDKNGKCGHVVKKSIEFNAETMYNIEYVQALLGNISGGLESMRKTRKENREKKKGPKLIFERKHRKFKNYDQMRKAYEKTDAEKAEEKKKKEITMNNLKAEQEKVDLASGNKGVSGIDKLKNLFRRRITK